VRSIFRVEWPELALEDVKDFFAGLTDEGESLTWEAKGGVEKPRSTSVRKAACAFANADGGFLILGADYVDGAWDMPGVAFPSPEPRTWISQVLHDGLRTETGFVEFDAHAWLVADSRHVAVVRVPPCMDPPCVTVDGQVFTRIPGSSVPIKDPSILADLLRRGRAARQNAEARARALAEKMLNLGASNGSSAVAAFAFASATARPDIGRRLFSNSFVSGLENHLTGDAVLTHERGPGIRSSDVVPLKQWSQSAISVTRRQEHGQYGWTICATWEGSVGITVSLARPEIAESHFTTDILEPVFGIGIDSLASLVGRPADDLWAFLASQYANVGIVTDAAGLLKPKETTAIDRVLDRRSSDALAISSIVREFKRAAGWSAFEGN
jgi:Schlafen, AlbA_2